MPRNKKNTRRTYVKRFNKRRLAKILGVNIKKLTISGSFVYDISKNHAKPNDTKISKKRKKSRKRNKGGVVKWKQYQKETKKVEVQGIQSLLAEMQISRNTGEKERTLGKKVERKLD